MDVVTHTCNPKTQRPKQEDYYEFHFSRGYRVRSWLKKTNKATPELFSGAVVIFSCLCYRSHTAGVLGVDTKENSK